MGMTMAEKILAGHAGRDRVEPGEIVIVHIDRAVMIDTIFRFPLPSRVWDAERVVVVADHYAPSPTQETSVFHQRMRGFVQKHGLEHVYDIGEQGISHVLVAEKGFALPGTILANSDSHSCASGAFNCASRGLGGAETIYAVAKGQTWFEVCPTVRFVLTGQLGERVEPRDVVHFIGRRFGDFPNRNVEYVGPLVETMDIAGRQTIATMSAELSAEFALFEADRKLVDYLEGRAVESFNPVFADDDAAFEAVHEVDVSALAPQVVLPGRFSGNARDVNELSDIKIDQAFVGSCANGRFEDLATVAQMVKGKHVAPGVRFIVTPGSTDVYRRALREGLVQTLTEAGVMVTASTCGACFGGHMGVLAPGERCITSSTRNFQGRMGSPQAEIFLASPSTVAASALAGAIADPRRT